MLNLEELTKEDPINVASVTEDGIDISLLTSCIRSVAELIETDMHWDYQSLQAEIGQNFREKYGDTLQEEGTRANNI